MCNAADTHSNAGGTDPEVVFAWLIALNVTSDFLPDFSGLLDYDIMSQYNDVKFPDRLDR